MLRLRFQVTLAQRIQAGKLQQMYTLSRHMAVLHSVIQAALQKGRHGWTTGQPHLVAFCGDIHWDVVCLCTDRYLICAELVDDPTIFDHTLCTQQNHIHPATHKSCPSNNVTAHSANRLPYITKPAAITRKLPKVGVYQPHTFP